MGRSREHVYSVCLAPELRVGLIKVQAEKELGESYALLLLITKALYQEHKISREVYELYTQRYSCKLVPPIQPLKLTASELKEQQKLEEKRRWFTSVKTEFFMDHRPLASGRSWREDVLGEAEKYKDKLPEAAEVLELRSKV
jgi:hypothetical protein